MRPGVRSVSVCAAEMANVIKTLTDVGLCSEVYYKELYLPATEINGKTLLLYEVISIGYQKKHVMTTGFNTGQNHLSTACVFRMKCYFYHYAARSHHSTCKRSLMRSTCAASAKL